MVIKINQAVASRGMVVYNDNKLKSGEATILGYNKIATDGRTIEQVEVKELTLQMEQRGTLYKGKSKKFIHLSINPNPDEDLSDKILTQVAKDYMKQLGYASQPYVIYKHTDIDRAHLHIISCNIKENGKRVPDSNLYRRSNDIRQGLEEKYGLIKGESQGAKVGVSKSVSRMDYRQSFTKSQLGSIGLSALEQVKFSSSKDYITYLGSLGVAARQSVSATGEVLGITYQPTDANGTLKGVPMKGSRVVPEGQLSLPALKEIFDKNIKERSTLLPAFEARLSSALQNGKAGLHTEAIQPLFSSGQPNGFHDQRTGHFYGLAVLNEDLQSKTVGQLKNEDHLPETSLRKTGTHTTSPLEEQSPQEQANGNLFGDIIAGLGEMGGDSYSPDNDKSLQKKRRPKRGI